MSKSNRLWMDILFDFVGCAIFGVGIHSFTAPNLIAPGGVSGIATILNFFTGLPIGTISLIINVPLLLIAYKFLGRAFTLNTLKTVLISTFMLDVALIKMPVYIGNSLLASVFGGLCIGLGLGIVFSRGSTTGGTDIIMRLIKLKLPHFSMGSLMMLVDLLVVFTSVIAFGNVEVGLYGIICIYVSSSAIDYVVFAGDKGKTVLVFSDKNTEIAEAIMRDISRGVTYLNGVGAYSMEDKKIILCAVRNNEFVKLKGIVYEIDEDAFVIVSDSEKIYGQGFKHHAEE